MGLSPPSMTPITAKACRVALRPRPAHTIPAMSRSFIADLLHDLHEARLPRRAPSDPRAASAWRRATDLRRRLPAAHALEIYAFRPAALAAAGDLRIDTPARMDGVFAALTAQPRRVLIEAPEAAFAALAHRLRGLVVPDFANADAEAGQDAMVGAAGQAGMSGRAALIEIDTDGVAHLAFIRRRAAPPDLPARGLPRPVRDSLRAALALQADPVRLRLDPARHAGLSRREFDRLAARVRPESDPILDRLARRGRDAPPRQAARLTEAAWTAMRLRESLRPTGWPDDTAPPAMEAAAHGEMVFAAALPALAGLALLDARVADLQISSRQPHAPRGTRGPSRGRAEGPNPYVDPGDQDRAGLRVVRLDLADRGLAALYAAPGPRVAADPDASGDTAPPGGAQDAGRRAPVCHPVRGHLFVARSGRLVWRRPHWRGTAAAIRDVTLT